MLQSLYIKNYAIINELEIQFHDGFSIITGETGAGKSILLGALSLIIGQRADTSVMNDKNQKCIVEGIFNIKGYELRNFFETNDIDYDDMGILRREIIPGGKSRAFVNDVPVNLNILKELGILLIDIHSQHQNLELNNNKYQLQVLDSLADNNELLRVCKSNFIKYQQSRDKLNNLLQQAEEARNEEEFIRFQYDELEKAKLQENEQEELEEELNILNHAGEIKSNLLEASSLLFEDESSVLVQLKVVRSKMEKIGEIYNEFGDINERLDSLMIELKDIADSADLLNAKVEVNPLRIDEINERLHLIYQLEQKHKCSNIKDLLALQFEYRNKLDKISNYDFEIEEAGKEHEQDQIALQEISDQLSENRQKVIPEVENRVTEILGYLGMPNARFKILSTPLGTFSGTGSDKIEFLFSANKQVELKEISGIASGGEISRLMLCIKSLLTRKSKLPTIIFDEIDTGVSGEIADKVGAIIEEMSYEMQVINITHLPQVASKGKYHYLVHKYDDNDMTQTGIKLLNDEERTIEIAKMLSGEELTDAAIKNAKELLRN